MSLINCKECGKEISNNATICPNCGAKNVEQIQEKASFGIKFICFLLPIIGIIVFATNISSKPKYAKECLIASLLPIILIIIWLLFSLLMLKPITDNFAKSTFKDKYCYYSGCNNKVTNNKNYFCAKHSYLEDKYILNPKTLELEPI